jgi:type I restriction enzyme S subunit
MGILHPCLIALRINTQICDINWAKIFINDSSCFATNIFLNSNATTIEVIYTDTLKNIVIPIPPVTEQEIIVAHIKEEISKIDAQISKANRRIELLNELKQSIITEAVTGKVKVC